MISPPVRAGSSSCSAYYPGISTEQLRSRLNRMVADGLLTRQRYREVPPRVDYELTERSRELIPVLGALARWGYDWTWSAPRPGEDVNVGAIFRLAPGILEPPAGLEGTVELIVEAEGDQPERQYLVTLSGGRAEISEVGGAAPSASVRGTVAAWVRALGPEGSTEALKVSGREAWREPCSTASRTQERVQLRPPPESASSCADPVAPFSRDFVVATPSTRTTLSRDCLTADHTDARRRDPRRSRHERAQCRVRLAVDRRARSAG